MTLHKIVVWIERAFQCKITGKFCDLGSGTGKGLIAADLLMRFDKISGIELLDGLYYESLRIRDKYAKLNRS